EIKHLIYENPDLKYNDIAVISNNIEEYAPVLETAFARYEIPCFMSIKKDVSHTVTMIYIFSLLDIISYDKYSTENILKYLKTGLTEINLAETSELENFCYKWSIDGKKWNYSFIPDNESDKEDFIKYEEIREKIIKPLDILKSSVRDENATADKICIDIYNFIVNTGADEKIKEIISYYTKNNESYLANEQKKIWDFLIDIIDDLHSVLYGRKMSLKQFSILFKQLLMQAKYSVPPQTLDGVITASIGISRLNSPKIVFILGANEESFPKSSMQDNLFLNDERQKLALNGFNDKKTQEHCISVSRLDVHKALSSAQEKLYISYSLTSLQGESIYMSSVINDILFILSMEKSDIIHESDISEDYYAVTRKSAYYHLMQNKKDAGESEKAIRLVLEKMPEYKTKIDYVYERSSQEENYKLSDRKILEKLVNFKNFRVSNTSLKKYNSCHFSYFCDYCLKLKKRQKIEMDNLNWGSLRHECFCVLLSSKKPLFTDMSKKEIEDIIKEVCQKFRDKIFKNGFKEDARTDFLFIKIAEQLLKICLNLQKELKMSDFIPTEFEVDINKNDNFSPLFIDGKNGTIIFGGTIDRIDVYTSDEGRNYIRIIDYKSSGQNIEKFLVNNGIDMQMILYMLALTRRGKFKNYFPAGLLYYPVTYGLPLASRRDNSPNSGYLDKELKLKGVALADEEILSAMDKSNPRTYIQTEKIGRTKPVVKAFNKKQFDDLIKFSENKIKEMNESLYDGDIDIDPLINPDYKIDACQYCEFVDICGNYPIFKSHTGNELDESDINNIFEPEKDNDKDNNKKEKK
ncbi:MAG: exodeoxyribonuclease V subunit gamma, partial [Oscillospiraceae bacterium]|nr:exodeoxyribonuclease V subunit gamma [Oscillospiraceae bacterium]